MAHQAEIAWHDVEEVGARVMVGPDFVALTLELAGRDAWARDDGRRDVEIAMYFPPERAGYAAALAAAMNAVLAAHPVGPVVVEEEEAGA